MSNEDMLEYAEKGRKETLRQKVKESVERKIGKGELQIIQAPWGIGKTYAIFQDAQKRRSSIIFSKEHKHLVEMETKFKDLENKKIVHWEGFERNCYILNDARHGESDVVRKLLKSGVNPSIIKKMVCGEAGCGNNIKCSYNDQFSTDVYKGFVIAPNEMIVLKKRISRFHNIFVDEDIKKWTDIYYDLTKSKIITLTDLKNYDPVLFSLKEKEKQQFKTFLEKLKEILLEFDKKIKDAFLSTKPDFHIETIRNKILIKEYTAEKESYHDITFIKHVLDVKNYKDRGLYKELSELLESNQNILNKVYFASIERRNYDAIKNIKNIKSLKEKFFYAFLPVQINERFFEGHSKEPEMGKIYGKGKKEAYFVYWIPQIFSFLDALAEGKSIKWTIAQPNKDIIRLLQRKYIEIRNMRTVLNGIDKDLAPSINFDVINFKLPKYESKIIRIKRKSGWSKTSMKKIYFDVFRDCVKKLLDDETGIISFKKIDVRGKKKNVVDILPSILDKSPEWINKHFKYWWGGGIEGSNIFEGFKKLIIIGTPNLRERDLISEHMKLFDELPASLKWDERKKQTIIDKESAKIVGFERIGFRDKQLDSIDKYERESVILDAVHRLRNIEEGKEVIMFCFFPDTLKEFFGHIEEIGFNELKVKLRIQDSVLRKKIVDRIKSGDGINIDEFSKIEKLKKTDSKKLIISICEAENLRVTYDWKENKIRKQKKIGRPKKIL